MHYLPEACEENKVSLIVIMRFLQRPKIEIAGTVSFRTTHGIRGIQGHKSPQPSYVTHLLLLLFSNINDV